MNAKHGTKSKLFMIEIIDPETGERDPDAPVLYVEPEEMQKLNEKGELETYFKGKFKDIKGTKKLEEVEEYLNEFKEENKK